MRNALFRCALVALVYLSLEAFSFAAFWVIDSEPFSFSRLAESREKRREIQRLETEPGTLTERTRPVWREVRASRFLPHPYLGAIPESSTGYHWWIPNLKGPPLNASDTRNVVLTGGSVAYWLGETSWEVLREGLSRVRPFRDQKLQLINLAYRSSKQPQQLMAVNYFLALGGRIDLLINLDGFNEVGLEFAANVKYGIFPAYPWTWVPLTKGLRTPRELESLGAIYLYRRLRANLARAMDPLGFSITASLLWRLLDRALEAREFRAIEAQVSESRFPAATRGPRFRGSDEAAFQFGVRLWRNASLSLGHLSAGHGFPYFHFLQPNQYVEDSKPFTAEEEAKFRQRAPLRELVPRWYPVLVESGLALREQGVNFFDLTRIYQRVEAPVYRDDCCHINRLGNTILAREIAREIAARLENRPPARKPDIGKGARDAARGAAAK
ncbi:MAG: hypothetical protein V3T14_03485 [Myxococcota bacterium]